MIFSRSLLFLSVILFSLCVLSSFASPTEEEDLFQQLLFQMDDPTLAAFNMPELRRNAAYSSISRCLSENVSSITNWTCKWCKDASKVNKLSDVLGGISNPSKVGWFAGFDSSLNQIVLVFKSSGSLENWILNLAADFVDYPVPGCGPDCKIHKGFLFGYREVRPAVLNALDRLRGKHPSASVSITGHSLGGALATIAALDIRSGKFSSTTIAGVEVWHNHLLSTFNELTDKEYLQLHNTALSIDSSHNIKSLQFNSIHDIPNQANYPLKYPIYNFGAPRVFNVAGAAFFSNFFPTNNFFRTTHRADTVPHLPLISWKANHIGREIFFPNKDDSLEYRMCSATTSEDSTCSNSQIAILFLDHKWYGGYSMLQNVQDCQ